MPTTLTYNESEREHVVIADRLGDLERTVDAGRVTSLQNSYYMGLELAEAGVVKAEGTEYRKMDIPGQGKGMRTKNRVVVVITIADGKLVEGIAYLWRHDDRVLQLSSGFFKRAKTMRDFK